MSTKEQSPAKVFYLDKSKNVKSIIYPKKHKGKLYVGTVQSGYTKTQISSIPSNTENFLYPIDSIKHRFAYIPERNPGVGSYSIASLPSGKIDSSKGYGNGFISNNIRFNPLIDNKPGPGEYQTDLTSTIEYHINNSLQGKSLYNAKRSLTFKPLNNKPGPGSYNPTQPNHQPNYNLNKGGDRFDSKRYLTENPGPGEYSPYLLMDTMEKAKMKSDYKPLSHPKPDLLKKYNIKTTQDKCDLKFQLKQNHKNIFKLTNLHPSFDMKYLDGIMPIYMNEINHVQREINHDIRNAIAKENELQAIKFFLGNEGGAPDPFQLNSPRWKHAENPSTKRPGPAYYKIKTAFNQHQSYNRNISDFLVTSGPLHNPYQLK